MEINGWLEYGYDGIAVGTNCTIRARLTDEQGEKGNIVTGTVSNIDTQAPEVEITTEIEDEFTISRSYTYTESWESSNSGTKYSYHIGCSQIKIKPYKRIAFRDSEKSKYSGSSGIMYYYICKPDGSVCYSDLVLPYINSNREVNIWRRACRNIYDCKIKYISTSYNLAKTRKVSGWYLFDIFQESNTIIQDTSVLNTGLFCKSSKYTQWVNSHGYWTTIAINHVHANDISTWPYNIDNTELLATSTLSTGSYIMVVDNAGNVTKKLISL